MERIRDSVRASCSSSFNSSLTCGTSFKRRPTSICQASEEEGWQTSALPDRAARKEIERQRLRKLLNQGKKKRRCLNGSKLITSPGNGVDDFHCHSRKSRSVGCRRKGKSWKSIGLLAQLQLPSPALESSPLSVQNEFEIEFEIAEVLSGLKKQLSSSGESLIDGGMEDLEKIRVENEENQSISVRAGSADQAFKYVETFKSENSISVTTNLEIQNHDKANLTTSQVIPAPMEATESNRADKFVIDLNELPPMESSLEGGGMERTTPDPKPVFNEEVQRSVSDEASLRRFVLPYKMEIKSELQDHNLRSHEDSMSQKQQKAYAYTSMGSDLLCPTRTVPANLPQGFSVHGNSIKDGAQDSEFYPNNVMQNYCRPASTLKITHEHASHQFPKPLQAGHIKVGPLIFPLSQKQSVMANHKVGLSRTASSTGNVRFTYPIGAPFLSVLPVNVCTPNPSYEVNRLHSSGGKSAQRVPFLDEQLHPQRIFLPIQIQHQKQANSSLSDIRMFSTHRNVTPQSLYPPRSPNVTSMPSATSLFSFASSTQSHFHLSPNPEAVPSFMDKINLDQQIPADHGSQQRNSEMIQKINQADSSLAAGEAPSWIKQSGFILNSPSISPASVGGKVFDT